MGFPCGSAGKESASNAGDLGSLLGLGKSLGEGKGYSLQYSGLKNSMDCIVHRVLLSFNSVVSTTVLNFDKYHDEAKGFSDISVGKESTYNAGDPSSIPGSGRSPGEGIGYPHQYSWASLVAQLVKNLRAMWEIWVLSLGWEDPLEKGKATHSNILAWRIPWTA